MTVAVSNTARLVVAIDDLCADSQALHDTGEAAGGEPLSFARFVEALTPNCPHRAARVMRRRLWATLADLAGVEPPDGRVRRQVLDYLQARSTAA